MWACAAAILTQDQINGRQEQLVMESEKLTIELGLRSWSFFLSASNPKPTPSAPYRCLNPKPLTSSESVNQVRADLLNPISKRQAPCYPWEASSLSSTTFNSHLVKP
jgi:hypothetical protein